MERIDMHSRNEYLKVLRGKYLKAKTRKEKTQILDEYCRNTGFGSSGSPGVAIPDAWGTEVSSQ